MARKCGFQICIFSFLFFSFLESRLLRVACAGALRVRCECVAGVVRALRMRVRVRSAGVIFDAV